MEKTVEAFKEDLVEYWVKLGMRGGQTKFLWP